MEDKTTTDQKVIIISKFKSQIIIPNIFVVVYHEYELRYCSCTHNKPNGIFNGNVLIRHGKRFSEGYLHTILRLVLTH